MITKAYILSMISKLRLEADQLEREVRADSFADDHEMDHINVVGISQNRKTAELLEKWHDANIEEKKRLLKEYRSEILPMFGSILRNDITDIRESLTEASAKSAA